MKNPLKVIKERRAREQELSDDVEFLNKRIEDMELEYQNNVSQYIRKNIQDVGYWKMRYEALDKEKDTWSEDARRLQDKIDIMENLSSNKKFLDVVRAVKVIANFKLPVND